jgi:hypothetical protein
LDVQEAHKLRLEEKISEQELSERLQESKMEIEKLMTKSHVTLETRKILQARASMLFPALPKRSKREQKTKDVNEENSSSK